MMTSKSLIRKHLFTHFREDLYKRIIKTSEGKLKCPQCDFENDTVRNFDNHIGIFHRVLDELVEAASPPPTPQKKKVALQDYKKLKEMKVKSNEASKEITKEAEKDSNSTAPNQQPMGDLAVCPICEDWHPKDLKLKHCLSHLTTEELQDQIEILMDLDPLQPCENCPQVVDYEHLAIDHKWLDIILRDEAFVQKKKDDLANGQGSGANVLKRRSSIDLTKNAKKSKLANEPFKCVLCDKMLSYRNHVAAVDHFGMHAWILMTKQKLEPKHHQWFNCLLSHLPIDSYLDHHGLTRESQEAKDFIDKMQITIGDIINGKWCCVCSNTSSPTDANEVKTENATTISVCGKKHHPRFLQQKLKTVDDIEALRTVISPKKSLSLNTDPEDKEFCEYCIDGFKSKEYYEHMALLHFKDYFKCYAEQNFSPDKKCTICSESGTDYVAETIDEMIMHLGKYHQKVDHFIEAVNSNNSKQCVEYRDIFEEMIEVKDVTNDTKIFECKKCSTPFFQLRELRLHIRDHIKKSWPLPKTHPYICPECFYEATTYLSLFKHVGTTHGPELKSQYNKIKFDLQKKQLPKTPSTNPNKLQGLPAINTIYKKKTFTISAPEIDVKPKRPKSKNEFAPMMRKLFQDINDDENEGEQMEVDQEEPKEDKIEEIANVKPHQRVAYHLDHQNDRAPHQWLCDGRLLMLEQARHDLNIKLFQEQWIRGQPVMVCNSSELMDKKLWHPQAFLNDFGHLHHDLINCLTGKTVPKASLAKFWSGFQYLSERYKDANGTPMLLKLKDWPPTEDIAHYIPVRFKDVMNAYP